MSYSVSLESLSFSYRGSEKQALKDLTARIEKGTFLAVMGASGAGKSTLCCALNGLIPRFFRGRYDGKLLVDGRDVRSCGIVELSRMVGLVLQDFEAQLFCTNVELEVAFGPENQGLSRETIRERIDRYLVFTGLSEMRSRDSATLSGGQKQRLAIASILAMEPAILVMDEPVTDLDPMGRLDVLGISDRLREQQRTMIVVDNEPDNVAEADMIWLMKEGGIAAQGSPEEIFSNVDMLESCGVMVPPTISLFRTMGWPGSPFGFEEARALIVKHNLAVPRQGTRERKSIAGAAGQPVLAAKNLSFRYPANIKDSLKGIDLQIGEGEFVALLGRNGSGKTTLAKQFNGLLRPTAGTMLINGKPTASYRKQELARLVGYVFQNPDHQIFASTVKEEVSFGLKILGYDRHSIEENTARALAATGLEGYEEQSPFVLTKGERQRVAVASVLAVRPRVIVLDEPTTGLDYLHQMETMKMLKSLNSEGHTIIIITHTMWIAESFAKRTIVMNESRIIADGPSRDVFRDEENLSRASLAPSSLVRLSNWLNADAMEAPGLAEEVKG